MAQDAREGAAELAALVGRVALEEDGVDSLPSVRERVQPQPARRRKRPRRDLSADGNGASIRGGAGTGARERCLRRRRIVAEIVVLADRVDELELDERLGLVAHMHRPPPRAHLDTKGDLEEVLDRNADRRHPRVAVEPSAALGVGRPERLMRRAHRVRVLR